MISLMLWILMGIFTAISISIEWTKYRTNKVLANFKPLVDWPVIGFGGTLIENHGSEATKIVDKLIMDPESLRIPVRFWLGSRLYIGISDPDDIKAVFTSDASIDKPDQYVVLGCKHSLGVADADEWKLARKALNPTFSNAMLIRLLPQFNANSRGLCEQIDGSGDRAGDFKALLVQMLVNQVIGALFEIDYRADLDEAMNVYQNILSIEDFSRRRMHRFWLDWDFAYQLTPDHEERAKVDCSYKGFLAKLTQFTCSKLSAQMAMGEDILSERSDSNTLTFVQKLLMLLREGTFTEQIVDDHLFLIFIAGLMTSHCVISTTLLLLAVYPSYQARIVDEMKCVFGSVDAPVTLDDLSKMTFTEMVLKESMRLFPPLPVLARKCNSDVQAKSGIIPKHATVIVSLPKLHRDPQQWGENANEFYPERFSLENMSDVHPYAFMSFSRGQRNCIGAKYAMMAMKVLLSHLLRRYEFVTELKFADIRLDCNISAYMGIERPFQILPRTF